MYGLYQLALLEMCIINIGSVIGIGRVWQKYNRYRYNLKLPYRYTSNFSYDGMQACIELAILDHSYNTQCQQATTKFDLFITIYLIKLY